MGKTDQQQHPASAALHGGLFYDRTLAQFEERRRYDPDKGTPHEGTVVQIPAPGEGLLARPKKLRGRSDLLPTTETPTSAMYAQEEAERSATRWWKNLSPKRKKELLTALPQLAKA